ncbi:sugar phosphate isomerase/epimerase [Gordonia sp. ABSL49_1]|uniref:sugar phosphate isomerase/epimerase family protein n=1 Tax=Gordonia sp. ABSL49_1 TaxID=2920941 RepID=UPI001F0D5EE1|nr:sugar phosphate isomerase/epimerase family protein [Gordonia sp. ABSL49_1]MCH5642315.1 sugar phosphate isomerase/epimerase [Gordonia sp. ABSL49_1]
MTNSAVTATQLRVAGAPISWGVCEVPGWGHQLPPERVFGEMHELGMTSAETGPEGFLPTDPVELRDALAAYGLGCVGSFVPVVLHDAAADPLDDVAPALDRIVTSGGDVLVVAAATGVDGYDSRPDLTEEQWDTLLRNLDRIDDMAAERGVVAALHPHVGTMIEQHDEVFRVIDGSKIGLCLDTGHLLIGGTDPLEVARTVPDRIRHAHLKDVRVDLAKRVQNGELTYTEAVGQGMYVPLGAGEAQIGQVVATLVDSGYRGWYVLEQDTILTSENDGDAAAGDVAVSLAFLRKATQRPVRV